jgi:hypothetical protein
LNARSILSRTTRDILRAGAGSDDEAPDYLADFLTAEDYVHKTVTSASAPRSMLRRRLDQLVMVGASSTGANVA